MTVDIQELLRHAPHLAGPIERGALDEQDLAWNVQAFLQASTSRIIVKLSHDRESAVPLPLLQPIFVRGQCVNRIFAEQVYAALLRQMAHDWSFFDGRTAVGAPLEAGSSSALSRLLVPASRSPGGQCENYDLRPWAGGYRGAYSISAEIARPGQNLGGRLLHYRSSHRGM